MKEERKKKLSPIRQLGLRKLRLALPLMLRLKLRPPKHSDFIIHNTTTMSARTATTARLLQQSHRLPCRILCPVRSTSSFSFPTCGPTWSRSAATAIASPSSRLPSLRNRHYSVMTTIDEPTRPIFAENVNPEQLSAPLQSLLEEEQWSLDEEGMGVAKTYYFKTYTKCLVGFSPFLLG